MIYLPLDDNALAPLHPDEVYNFNHPRLLEPSHEDIERLRQDVPSLFKGRTTRGATSRYDLDQLHFPDYTENWDSLDWVTQRLLQEFSRSSWKGCQYRRGLKSPLNVAEHALLFIGGAIYDTEAAGRAGTRLVRSLFMNERGKFLDKPSNLRQFGPHAARRLSNKLLATRDFEAISRVCHAFPLIIHAPRSIQTVGEECSYAVETYHTFYRQAGLLLERWSRRKAIRGIVGSSEISCSSIQEGCFHPHVHALVWTETEGPDFIRELPPDWTAKLEFAIQELNHIENKINYFCKAYGLSATYRREIERDNPDRQEFNRKTINAWCSLRRLRPSRGVRILNIPKRQAN
jgi:hypothetical protein